MAKRGVQGAVSESRNRKLAAMAGQQKQSPHEAEIARRLLRERGLDGNPMLKPPRQKIKPQDVILIDGEWVIDDGG